MENQNPYQTPSPAGAEDEASGPLRLPPSSVSLFRRFTNFAIDRIAIVGMLYGLGMIIAFKAPPQILHSLGSMGLWGDIGVSIAASIIYYTAGEALFGRTLGKLFTGTRVIGEDGLKPGFGRSLLRALCRCIPLEPLSFYRSDRRGWHDSLTKTWVVGSEA